MTGDVKTKAEGFGWDEQDLRVGQISESLARKSGEFEQPKKRLSLPNVIQAKRNGYRVVGRSPSSGQSRVWDFKSWEAELITRRRSFRMRF